MSTADVTSRRTGFTLVEILVVISIITLLVAIMLPAFGVVRTKAKQTQTTTQIGSLEQGLETYRGESALGSVYPPSHSDWGTDHQLIADPNMDDSAPDPTVRIAGAHLLLQAMLGADLLGTAGFRDLDYDGTWADDTHAATEGLYELDDTGAAQQPRYGGAGYVGDKMTERVRSLQQLQDTGVIAPNGMPGEITSYSAAQLLFVDVWEHPILYYRANPAAQRMLGTDGDANYPGIFKQWDNGIITGCIGPGSGPYVSDGIDFGGREFGSTFLHGLTVAKCPGWNPEDEDVLAEPTYTDSFARFILDPTVRARNTPVRKDTFLLISAGADAVYGTSDDVINWTRQ